jgi:arylsulfatase A-like enzyme
MVNRTALLASLAFMACWANAGLLAQKGSSKHPNILVIFSDDHTRQAISAYGNKLVATPGIDRLAKEGAIFTNSFVTNSICAPSRAVLLTGKYGHLSGLIDNSPNRRFDGSQQQVQKLLAHGGYQTAWIGKWHLQTLPQGFQYWQILPDQGHYYNPNFITMRNDTVRHQGYVTDLITRFSTNWLDNRDTTKPFFLVIGHKATHREWQPDLQDLGAYDDIDFPLPDNFFDRYEGRKAAANQDMTIDKTMRLALDLKVHIPYETALLYGRFSPEQKAAFKGYYDRISATYESIKGDPMALLKWKYQRYLKDYYATARSLDRNIAQTLEYLDKHNLAANTLVVYASDQGFYLGEHGWFDKRFMYEESLSTPLLMRYPGVVKPGTVVSDMVVNIDWAPTLIDAAGLPIPGDIQGKSVLPLLKAAAGAGKAWRNAMYYRYYEYPDPHRVAPHIGIRTHRHKLIWFQAPENAWELYDLEQDKLEVNNLYGKREYAGLVKALQQQLVQLAVAYKDEDGAAKIRAAIAGR